MANSESQIFTFTWRIDDWSMYAGADRMESPLFVVDFLGNTEWSIRMEARYFPESRFIGEFDLVRAEGSEYTEVWGANTIQKDITIAYSLAVHSTYINKDFKTEMISEKFGPGDFHRSKVEMDFTHEKVPLPNDTLTVSCQMSRCKEEVKNKDVAFQGLNGDFWNSRVPCQKYECSARSRVRVTSKSFVWAIQRIRELPGNVKLLTSLPSLTKSLFSFDLSLHLKEDSEKGKIICIEMHTKNVYELTLCIFIKCRIKTVGAPSNIQFKGMDQREFFITEDNFLFPNFLKMKDLMESYLDHTDGTLYLQFDLSFATDDDVVHTKVCEGFPFDIKQRDISHASASIFGELYRNPEHGDATLLVGDREFKAHKLILITGSDVFRRKFESGMKEGSGIVDIDDLDPDTVERLLKYLYTEEVGDLNSDDVMKLYYAAHKYNVGSLKGRLRPRLIANFSVSTVCEMLMQADTHKDGDLWESIVDYLHMNANEIFRSDNWKDFTVSHSSLAARSMLEVFTRKYKDETKDYVNGGDSKSHLHFLQSSGEK